jgi:hypothetical protein
MGHIQVTFVLLAQNPVDSHMEVDNATMVSRSTGEWTPALVGRVLTCSSSSSFIDSPDGNELLENFYVMDSDEGIPDCLSFCSYYAPGYIALDIDPTNYCRCYSNVTTPVASDGAVALQYCGTPPVPKPSCEQFCGTDLSQACDESTGLFYGDGTCTTLNGTTVKIECGRAWNSAREHLGSVAVDPPVNLETCHA